MRNFVVFDLDGTLLNTIPDIAAAMNRVLFRFGLPQFPEDSFRAFTGNGARVLTQRALAGREELLDQVYPAYLNDYARNNRVNSAPYEGIPELLRRLNETDIGVIVYSNKDDPDTREVIAHYFPDIVFAGVQGSRRDLPLKPDPTALKALMETLGLAPEEGLYLGDTVTDMQCAKAAGIYAVAALYGFQPREELETQHPDAMIGKPLDLLGIIRQRFGKG